MARLLKPNCPQCKQPARGTVEVLSGMATIEIEKDGTYDHDGNGTEIWWDCAETKTNERGEINLICRDGHDWYSPVEMPGESPIGDRFIGKTFRTKTEDREEDEEFGEVTHPIGSTFTVKELGHWGEDGPSYHVLWHQAVSVTTGESVPAAGMWTIWTATEIETEAEEVAK